MSTYGTGFYGALGGTYGALAAPGRRLEGAGGVRQVDGAGGVKRPRE